MKFKVRSMFVRVVHFAYFLRLNTFACWFRIACVTNLSWWLRIPVYAFDMIIGSYEVGYFAYVTCHVPFHNFIHILVSKNCLFILKTFYYGGLPLYSFIYCSRLSFGFCLDTWIHYPSFHAVLLFDSWFKPWDYEYNNLLVQSFCVSMANLSFCAFSFAAPL